MPSITTIRKKYKIKPLDNEHWEGFFRRCKVNSRVRKEARERARRYDNMINPKSIVQPICHEIWNCFQKKL
jgi:hypothetical protein